MRAIDRRTIAAKGRSYKNRMTCGSAPCARLNTAPSRPRAAPTKIARHHRGQGPLLQKSHRAIAAKGRSYKNRMAPSRPRAAPTKIARHHRGQGPLLQKHRLASFERIGVQVVARQQFVEIRAIAFCQPGSLTHIPRRYLQYLRQVVARELVARIRKRCKFPRMLA